MIGRGDDEDRRSCMIGKHGTHAGHHSIEICARPFKDVLLALHAGNVLTLS